MTRYEHGYIATHETMSLNAFLLIFYHSRVRAHGHTMCHCDFFMKNNKGKVFAAE